MTHELHIPSAVVNPVFQMVPIAPLVVEPGGGIAQLFPLGSVGTAGAAIVFCANPELGPGIFAHIVHQPLADQSNPEAILHHQKLMMRNGFKVPQGMHGDSSCIPESPENGIK